MASLADYLAVSNEPARYSVEIARMGISLDLISLNPIDWRSKFEYEQHIEIAPKMIVAADVEGVFSNPILLEAKGVDNAVDCVKATLRPGEIMTIFNRILKHSGFNLDEQIKEARQLLKTDSEAHLLRIILERYKKTPYEVYSEPPEARTLLYAMVLQQLEDEEKAEKKRKLQEARN